MSYMEKLGKVFVFVLSVLVLSFQSSLLAQEYKNKDVNKDKSSSQKSSDNRDNAFQKTAKDLTLRLSRSVNLSEDQSGKVSDILVNLQKDLADKQSSNKSEAVGSSDKKDFTDADVKANDKIEKIITDKDIPAYIKIKKAWWAKIKDKVYSENFASNENQSKSKDMTSGKKSRRGTDKNEAVGSSKSDNQNVTGENKDKDNPQFEQFAKDMSVDLMKKLDLSLEKAADVEDVLIDYQKNIADAQKKFADENRSNVADNTGAVKSRRENERNANVGSSRNARSNEMQSAIRSADDKIVDVLNDNQKPKYDKVKKQWWRDVESKVSSTVRRYERTNK